MTTKPSAMSARARRRVLALSVRAARRSATTEPTPASRTKRAALIATREGRRSTCAACHGWRELGVVSVPSGAGRPRGRGLGCGAMTLLRVRVDLAYDGTDFSGWAAQPGRRTVEGELSAA